MGAATVKKKQLSSIIVVITLGLAVAAQVDAGATESHEEQHKAMVTVEPQALSAGTIRVNPKDGLSYVWIPSGSFIMGCSAGDNECFDDEKPAHQVTLSKGFWIAQTLVSRRLISE